MVLRAMAAGRTAARAVRRTAVRNMMGGVEDVRLRSAIDARCGQGAVVLGELTRRLLVVMINFSLLSGHGGSELAGDWIT